MQSLTTRAVLGAVLLTVLAEASSTPLAAQATKGVHVCLGTDNLLRFTTGDQCPQGQRMFRLAEVEDEVGIAKERDDPPNAVIADLKAKLNFLTQRVTNLETEFKKPDNDPKLPTQVKAPFEVVDKSGNPIFVVADALHKSIARRGRFEIGRGAEGSSYTMVVRSAVGSNLLGIGENADGGGWYVADPTGATRIYASGAEGVKLYNKSTKPVAHLLASPGGNGQFWLYDAGGRAMVNAGTDGTVGVVQTGPNIKCAPQAGLRVGDCLRGRP
jgi:hypothetical protein